jgi:hypothetical protein
MALTLDELLFESNAPAEVRRSDIYTRFHLMCLNPSRRDLFETLTTRLESCRQEGVVRAESLLRAASEVEGTSEQDVKEFGAFVKGLSTFFGVVGRLHAQSSRSRAQPGLATDVWDEIDEEAGSILRDGEAFRAVVRASLESYSSDGRSAIERALRMVHDAMEEVGVERQEILRDARGLLTDIQEDPEALGDPVLWFYQGWLSWRRNLDPEVTRNAFFQACLGSSSQKDVLYWLSCRQLAYHQAKSEEYDSAYSTARQALAVRTDAATFLDVARYAAACGRMKEAAGAAARCMSLCPLTVPVILAAEELAE